jgi:hypothetical protein
VAGGGEGGYGGDDGMDEEEEEPAMKAVEVQVTMHAIGTECKATSCFELTLSLGTHSTTRPP